MYSYKTKLRIRPWVIKEELQKLFDKYQTLDPTGELRKTHKKDNVLGADAARSMFTCWNNLNHFYLRLTQQEPGIEILKTFQDGSVLIEVTASAQGNSARIYFKPSITNLTKEVRKAIVPIQDGNVFIYTDIKAAEFALRAIQACDKDALNVYQSGQDIYMHFAPLFPEGTDRKTIKTILIANMYGKSAYSTAKDLGITETQAQRLLDTIAVRMPLFTLLKRRIIAIARQKNGYFSPRGFNQSDLVKVADIDPSVGINPNLAWSVHTQSALGFIMQDFSTRLLNHQQGIDQTFLSIFDSVVVEIKPESKDRFEKFFRKCWSPLIPDGFHLGDTMYSAMYEN